MNAVTKPFEAYHFTFEGEYGMEHAVIYARTYTDAVIKLTEEYPDDEGADGFCDCPDGSERPIHW